MDSFATEAQIPPTSDSVKYVTSDAPFKKWICLYPIYLDANRSLTQGRKVPKKIAFPDPYPRAMVDAVRRLKLPVFVEPHKMHPRDFENPGRIRVQIRDTDGSGKLFNSEITCRGDLFYKVAELLHEIQPHLNRPEPQIPPHIEMLIKQAAELPEPKQKEPEKTTRKKKNK